METIANLDEKFERFFEWLNEDGNKSDEMKKKLVVAGMFGTLLVLGALVEGVM